MMQFPEELSIMLLLGAGLIGLAGFSRRKFKK
jgi:LPXTG-motif cell wall-anchored protein